MQGRRNVLSGGVLGLASIVLQARRAARADGARTFQVIHDDAEWRKLLTPAQFEVLRKSGTEPPFSSALLHEKRKGLFACAGCKQELFSSATKFESGTGWPSFWMPLESAVGTSRDISFGMVRTAVFCARCGGHQGHVFEDGPRPTGLRYCMNGVAMTFQPATG
jgi:peptide-methionine (R)-S-oxide reductase